MFKNINCKRIITALLIALLLAQTACTSKNGKTTEELTADVSGEEMTDADSKEPKTRIPKTKDAEADEEATDMSLPEPEFFFDRTKGLYGLRDEKEDIIAEPKWTEVSKFSEGLAWVAEKPDGDKKRIGYIDYSGKYVIQPQNFDYAYDFSEGLAAVRLSSGTFPSKCIYLDKKGDVALGEKFNIINAGYFVNGYAIVDITAPNDCRRTIIDKSGNRMLTEFYDSITYSKNDDMYIAEYYRNSHKTIFISGTFKKLAEFSDLRAETFCIDDNYNERYFFNEKGCGILIATDTAGAGGYARTVIDKNFKIIATGDNITLDKNYIRVTKDTYSEEMNSAYYHDLLDSKVMFMDYGGKDLTGFKYDYVDTADGDFYAYHIGNKWGYLDGNLNEVVSPTYDYTSAIGENYHVVIKDGKYGYVNKNFAEAIAPQYYYAGEFVGGIAPIIDNGEFFFINTSGRKVQVTPERKLDYLKKTDDAIENFSFLFYSEPEEKINKYLSGLYYIFRLPEFDKLDDISKGSEELLLNTIWYMFRPQTDTLDRYRQHIKMADVKETAALLYGKEVADRITPMDTGLYTYDNSSQEFSTVSTGFESSTSLVVLSCSENNNMYEVIISTALVRDVDFYCLFTTDGNDVANEALYFDFPGGEGPNYNGAYGEFLADYELFESRGIAYIKAHPEMFEKYKVTLEINGEFINLKSVKKV